MISSVRFRKKCHYGMKRTKQNDFWVLSVLMTDLGLIVTYKQRCQRSLVCAVSLLPHWLVLFFASGSEARVEPERRQSEPRANPERRWRKRPVDGSDSVAEKWTPRRSHAALSSILAELTTAQSERPRIHSWNRAKAVSASANAAPNFLNWCSFEKKDSSD